MNPFTIIAILVTLAAVFSYVNYRCLRLPPTIGLMLLSLVGAMVLIGLRAAGLAVAGPVSALLAGIDFNELLMHGMLSFLLFAGALQIDLDDLLSVKLEVTVFATAGVLLSTLLVGLMLFAVTRLLGLELGLMHCLLFGALISPTDPVAVLPIMRRAGASRRLEYQVAGESLFNDGVGVVVFVVLADLVGGHAAGPGGAALLLAREAGGGLAFGLVLGYVGYRLLRSIDNYPVEILITLAMVAGGYAFAWELGISGPLAMVVAGVLIGNHGRRFAMSDRTRAHIDHFWELMDVILNAVLFVLIGLEVLALAESFSPVLLAAGVAAIPLVLAARAASIGAPMLLLARVREFPPRSLAVLTWAALRGGIPVALALSLPPGPERQIILPITYVVVVFSILVQGTTIKRLIPRAA